MYATSNVSHQNYELFAISSRLHEDGSMPTPVRVSFAYGFDGLPVYNQDGSLLMWTGQRTEPDATGNRSSQLYIARTAPGLPEGLKLPAGGAAPVFAGPSDTPVADALASVSDEARVFNDHLTTLASPVMEGRFPGTAGIEIAENYIANAFETMGLAPAFGRGADASYFQPFEFTLRSPSGTTSGDPVPARNVGANPQGARRARGQVHRHRRSP